MEGRDQPPPDDPQPDDPQPDDSPWVKPSEGEEPEPDWAEQIRSRRRARGSSLREVYSKFADEPTPLDDEADPE